MLTEASAPGEDRLRIITDARTQAGDRIKKAQREKRDWKLAFWSAFALLLGTVASLVYVALQPRFVPYVVAVDKLGVAMPIAPASRADASDPSLVATELTRFVVNVRGVSTDRFAQASMVERAYAYASPQVATQLNGYFRQPENDSRLIGERAVRTVHVQRVTPLPPPAKNTWNVRWSETEAPVGTGPRSTVDWEAYLTVRQLDGGSGGKTAKQVELNPYGIYVVGLSWSQVSAPDSTQAEAR